MGEHELIMLVAAPLLVLSRPLETMLWAWPGKARKVIGRLTLSFLVQGGWSLLSGAVFATVLQAAARWLWHGPILFELALAQDGWHIAQHLSFLISALLFWSAMLYNKHTVGGRGLAVLCLFATVIVGGARRLDGVFGESLVPAPCRVEARTVRPDAGGGSTARRFVDVDSAPAGARSGGPETTCCAVAGLGRRNAETSFTEGSDSIPPRFPPTDPIRSGRI
nr:cytochrome c oxidase assembly protein [Peristeroidobacter agariperforans]